MLPAFKVVKCMKANRGDTTIILLAFYIYSLCILIAISIYILIMYFLKENVCVKLVCNAVEAHINPWLFSYLASIPVRY